MSTESPLDDIGIDRFHVEVPLDTSEHDDVATAKEAIVTVVARSIVDFEDRLDPEDAEYISTKVSFDEDGLDTALDDDDDEVVTVETETPLASLKDDE